jgi:mono/diheme cytochrome c family protein
VLLLLSWAAAWSRPQARGAERVSPAQVPRVTATAALFRKHCLGCHDSDGRGEAGRALFKSIPDFTDERWQAARTDQQIGRAILEGQGKSMPSMKVKLSPAEAGRLVTLVRGFRGGRQVIAEEGADPSPADAPAAAAPATRPNPVPAARPEPAPDRLAAAVFQRTCRNCHGADGKGDALRPQMPAIPDFTSPSWQAGRSRAELTASILEGRGRQMPAFGGSLSPAQSRALAEYVLTFGPRRAAPAASSAEGFDAQFSKLRREFESLQREYRALSRQSPRDRPSTARAPVDTQKD